MSSDVVIHAVGIAKKFKVFRSPGKRIVNALTFGAVCKPDDFWALDDLNLAIRRGETVGLLGANGSGKSTFLQMVAGTMTPTRGRVEIGGRVAALLELGAGFNPDFTGRENALLSIRLLAPDETDPAERMRWIEDFAEIGHHIDHPVRTYSSGMFVRLAFAVVASVKPDVLLVDEALGVGDAAFQQKCFDYMRSRMAGAARLVVSHDLAAIAAVCDRVCVLSGGRIVFDGDVGEGITEHLRRCHAAEGVVGGLARSGPREIDIEAVEILVNGQTAKHARPGDAVCVKLTLNSSLATQRHCVLGLIWADRFGRWIVAENTMHHHGPAPVVPPGRSVHVVEHAWPELLSGDYLLTPEWVSWPPTGQASSGCSAGPMPRHD